MIPKTTDTTIRTPVPINDGFDVPVIAAMRAGITAIKPKNIAPTLVIRCHNSLPKIILGFADPGLIPGIKPPFLNLLRNFFRIKYHYGVEKVNAITREKYRLL